MLKNTQKVSENPIQGALFKQDSLTNEESIRIDSAIKLDRTITDIENEIEVKLLSRRDSYAEQYLDSLRSNLSKLRKEWTKNFGEDISVEGRYEFIEKSKLGV